jgi:hypothetical protein
MTTALCIPIHTYCEPATQNMVEAACVEFNFIRPNRHLAYFREVGNSDIAAARTYLAHRAFQAGAERILWVDADMHFTLDDVARLLSGTALVRGTNYWTRSGIRASWGVDAGGEFEMGDTGQVYAVDYVGFGLTVTEKQAFGLAEKTKPTLLALPGQPGKFVPHVFKQRDDEHQEDGVFCARVREQGGTVSVDTRICPGHGPGTNPVYWWTNQMKARAPKHAKMVCDPVVRAA